MDFVQAAVNAVVQMMDDPMHAVMQVVKEGEIPSWGGGGGICHIAKAKECGKKEGGGVFHGDFS